PGAPARDRERGPERDGGTGYERGGRVDRRHRAAAVAPGDRVHTPSQSASRAVVGRLARGPDQRGPRAGGGAGTRRLHGGRAAPGAARARRRWPRRSAPRRARARWDGQRDSEQRSEDGLAAAPPDQDGPARVKLASKPSAEFGPTNTRNVPGSSTGLMARP